VEQIDVIRRLVEKYPLYLSLVSSADGKILCKFSKLQFCIHFRILTSQLVYKKMLKDAKST
jgi:hypothetical protein